jgi:hypothetical protein
MTKAQAKRKSQARGRRTSRLGDATCGHMDVGLLTRTSSTAAQSVPATTNGCMQSHPRLSCHTSTVNGLAWGCAT